jgi:hypothetical protein
LFHETVIGQPVIPTPDMSSAKVSETSSIDVSIIAKATPTHSALI